MSLDDASRAQIRAADPSGSTWLTANAGSGKTRVLTDRVAWLLLNGARPERILCLTFTKAAASEMQNRLFKRLGEWAMLGDADLSAALDGMGVPVADRGADRLRMARTLFARAIEAPGGLKIQTIHAFAAGILRRFPLEAGVSPGFQEIEERAQVILMDEVLDALAEGPEAGAVAGVARYVSGSDLRGLMFAVLGKRAAFEGPVPDYHAQLGLASGDSAEALISRTILGDEKALFDAAAPGFNEAWNQHNKPREVAASFDWNTVDLAGLARLEAALLTGEKAKEPFTPSKAVMHNKAVLDSLGDRVDDWRAMIERIAATRPVRLRLLAAARAEALGKFARAFIPAYDAAKELRGWLDFSDLIRCTRMLLTNPEAAPWVLFRLDGGIDHLLVDEAQDTSPEQWDIVTALAEEFAAGQGAREDVARTLFVVGDVKQSIYSFQGADPAGFARMRAHFEGQLKASPAPLKTRELVISFRSSPLILDLVDEVAVGPAAGGIGDDVRHAAFHAALPGRVDLWPVIEKEDSKEDQTPWYDPVDLPNPKRPEFLLAGEIAKFIKETLDAPPLIRGENGERALEPGDILVLVRRRSGLFSRLIKELKWRGLPILGADRFTVTEQLAVQDLMALLRVLATSADDLSLAAVLRSPLFGFDDDALYRLAHGRSGTLWARLGGEPADILQDLRKRAASLRPYELLERALTHHGMRMKLIARLGREAEDGIDALLGQALSFERTEVPSLTGFLSWLEADKLEVKREAGQSSGQIRVMTVHGAKGLEAPLVILPETAVHRPRNSGPNVMVTADGLPLWSGPAQEMTADMRALREQEKAEDAAEQDRLLYVAMTRAAQWLVVAAAGTIATKEKPAEEASWYGRIEAAARRVGGAEVTTSRGTELRLSFGDWSQAVTKSVVQEAETLSLPDWAKTRPATVQAPRARAPSGLGGAKALFGDPGARDDVAALRHGRLTHLLLEHLPRVAPPGWATAAPGILALDGPERPDAEETEALLSEAGAVLQAPDLRPLFARDALAEVALTAHSATLGCQLVGQIDRLLVTEERVLAVDFKTNALVPEDARAVPEGLLRQMGAYAEMLAPLYPQARIETAILWTARPSLMILPHDAVMDALSRATEA